MQQVNVFIETSSRFRGNVERKCGYVLSTQLRTGKATREHFGRVTGTYHQAILLTMVDALDHMTRTCDVCFYISDLYVTSRLGKITEMAGSGWLDTKGKPIANREEWRRLFKAINQLPDPHKISAKTEKHSYSAWLREEMKHRECGRILGQRKDKEDIMRTIAIINLKGGVAKTTSSINIAYILMRKGYKVLLVDNDKQGDCSRGMNRRTQDGEGIDRIMVDRHPDMEKLINKTDYLHLDIITANLGLLTANMEVTMDRVRPQQNRLRKALQQVADNYDFCVIDNAPDINVSVINALTAADDVLIPVEVDDNTLEGMNELLDQIDDVKEELNPDLKNVRCFITKYQKFNQAHLQGAEIIEEQYPIMRTKIRFSGVVARSTFVRMPVALHSPRSAAAEDYETLVNEYLDMIGDEDDGEI